MTETAAPPRVANHAPAPRVDTPKLIVESGQGPAFDTGSKERRENANEAAPKVT